MFESDYQPSQASILLKEATEHRKINNWGAAIECLRNAYRLIDQASTIYPIETYLRLPMYLHQSGQTKEAWIEFQHLIDRTKFSSVRYCDLHAIFDKICLCLQRDKLHNEALKYGMLAYLCYAYARFEQMVDMSDDPWMRKGFEQYTTTEAVQNAVTTLLKHTKYQHMYSDLCIFLTRQVLLFPTFKLNVIERELSSILSN